MKWLFSYLFAVLYLYSIGCVGKEDSQNNKAIEIIDVPETISFNNSFSDLGIQAKYIKLDTIPAISNFGIGPIQEANGLIYINTGRHIATYDYNGELKNDYFHQFVDERWAWYTNFNIVGDSIYTYFRNRSKLIIYPKGGNEAKVFDFPKWLENIYPINDSLIWLYTCNEPTLGAYNLILYNRKNEKVINSFLPFDNKSQYLHFIAQNNFFRFSKTLNFYMPFHDTIYEINEYDILPKYVINFGNKTVSDNDFDRGYENIMDFLSYLRGADFNFNARGLGETNDWLVFTFENSKYNRIFLYNKRDDKGNSYSHLLDDKILLDFVVDFEDQTFLPTMGATSQEEFIVFISGDYIYNYLINTTDNISDALSILNCKDENEALKCNFLLLLKFT